MDSNAKHQLIYLCILLMSQIFFHFLYHYDRVSHFLSFHFKPFGSALEKLGAKRPENNHKVQNSISFSLLRFPLLNTDYPSSYSLKFN